MQNKLNNRIITKNSIFKLNDFTKCNYCNVDDINGLFHSIFVCIRFRLEKMEIFHELFNYDDEVAFLFDCINSPNESQARRFVGFMLIVLNQIAHEAL